MILDEAKTRLVEAGFVVSSEQRANNDLGWQLRLTNGGIVNVFDTGAFNVQGKCQPEIKDALGAAPTQVAAPKPSHLWPPSKTTTPKCLSPMGTTKRRKIILKPCFAAGGLNRSSLISCRPKARQLLRSLKNTLLMFSLRSCWLHQMMREIEPEEMMKKHIGRVRV